MQQYSRLRAPGWAIFESAHDKTYIKTCRTSKDSDQPVHSPSMAKVLLYPSLDNTETVEGIYVISNDSDQIARIRRLIRVLAGRTSLIVSFVVRWLNFIVKSNEPSYHKGLENIHTAKILFDQDLRCALTELLVIKEYNDLLEI